MKNKSHYKLGEFKETANEKGKPENMFRFYASNKVNTKAKRNGEQDIIEYVFQTVFWQVVKASAEIERDKIEIQAKL